MTCDFTPQKAHLVKLSSPLTSLGQIFQGVKLHQSKQKKNTAFIQFLGFKLYLERRRKLTYK